MRSEGAGDVFDFLAIDEEFFGLGVDGEDGAGGDGVGFFEDGLAFVIEDGVAFCVFLFDPVLEVEADAAGDVDSS